MKLVWVVVVKCVGKRTWDNFGEAMVDWSDWLANGRISWFYPKIENPTKKQKELKEFLWP